MKKKLKTLFDKFHLPRWIVLTGDITLIVFTFILSNFFLLTLKNVALKPTFIMVQVFAFVPFFILGAWLFKSYHGVLRHTAIQDAERVVKAHIVGTVGMYVVSLIGIMKYPPLIIPFSIIFTHFFFSVFTLIALRFVVQYMYHKIVENPADKLNVLIFGAGELGMIAKGVLKNDKRMAYNVVGFMDDNPGLNWKTLKGLMVWPVDYVFENILIKKEIKEVIIAINTENISHERKREVIDLCIEHNVMVREIPEPSVWINGVLKTEMIRKVNIEDLLGRPPIMLKNPVIAEGLKNKRVMVTGGAGSIGSEIVRQLARFTPKSITVVDQGESALYDLQMELKNVLRSYELNFEIADVTDSFRMRKVFEQYHPDVIFHASAYKHVPLMEESPYEAVRTNVGGTMVVSNLASEFKAERFVMVSTDKAVNPTNVMGATKRMCEIYTQSMFVLGQSKTQFITTRFGNVLGSNGSVIPLFRKQIENGGPVTITHKDIIRYFMTIPEACQLVLEAGFTGKGGEIFLFDMGKPVKILDLARKMIALSGLIPDKDIKIIETGLRPGEKLYEELLASREETIPTHNEKLMIAKVRPKDYSVSQKKIIDLVTNIKHYSEFELVAKMKDILPSYISNNSKFSVLDNTSDNNSAIA